ncbi:Uma2 family endonuclease [Clostridium swellfunianum]|uniref:Uma2 family endonuclease n=1 Tax=Clostridium swellfunianum TaxID=1367462 RepID=UPI002030C28D|nr:Uma2 family endonuclease [Clostridium swellfunianum]MCM0651079.1 Uma2 family endonuclease [Clostridium swellfunianum]
MLPQRKRYTYDEFLEITKDIDRAEFIDGEIIMQATPTAQHQSIVLNIASEFRSFFLGKSCKPFIAPFDIILQDGTEEIKRVQPDISIICEHNLINENQFKGVPSLIVEVVSPSNASDDYVKKLNLYMKFGVEEYWIVSPKNRTVQIFNLENGVYGEPKIYFEKDIVKSSIFEDLSIGLKSIFE